jgi:predicted solute-binding protein
MKPVRLGAVDYLNARPLVFGLELQHGFALRFDPPSKCAALLHEGSIDVGMIPSIEYVRGGEPYCVVPDVAIVSDGPVASVAMFTRKAPADIRSIAADTSSRTSVGLLRILCCETLGIDAELVPMPPRPAEMLRYCDAALLIGDAALFFDYEAAGLRKVDLGQEWTGMTRLPFVWAFWAGRPAALDGERVGGLVRARDRGVEASAAIAQAYCAPEWAERGRRYLTENIRYGLGARELEGLRTYYDLAVTYGVIDEARQPVFYPR